MAELSSLAGQLSGLTAKHLRSNCPNKLPLPLPLPLVLPLALLLDLPLMLLLRLPGVKRGGGVGERRGLIPL